MENISLSQIAAIITFLSLFIGAMVSVLTFLKKLIQKALNPLYQKMDHLETISLNSRNQIELELIKIDLINFMHDVEEGIEKTLIQKQNAYELYDRYQKLGGNSYIHDRWQKLMKEGKL